MRSHAVLDFIGLPVHVPGNLEARLRRVHFRDDGGVIDDGSRSGPTQTGCHRFVASAGDDLASVAASSIAALGEEGYAAPDLATLQAIAAREWDDAVLAARRQRLVVDAPELRLVVRALGFDLIGAGELAIGLGLARVTRKGAELTAKSSLKLLPGDPLDLAFRAVDAAATLIGCTPLCAEDRSLITTTAARLWTPAALTAREAAWLDWQARTGLPIDLGAALDLADRLHVAPFNPIPTGPAPAFAERKIH